MIHWHPPQHENGGPVLVYQLEMTDQNMTGGDQYADTDSEDEDESRSESSMVSATSLGSSSLVDNIPNEDKINDGNKWHRVIKHRDTTSLNKYVMGLETYHDYYFRVICKNEFGWSRWSKWSGPFTPQEGVVVKKFGQGWLKIGWIEPSLTNGRTVTKYEVQMCQPQGAMSSNVSVYEGSKEDRKLKSGAVNYVYETVCDNITEAEATIENLLPGKKYQFRVRPCIDGEWCSWEYCVLSNVLSVPSTAPDVPHHVRVMLLPEYRKVELKDEKPLYESFDNSDKEDEHEFPAPAKSNIGVKAIKSLRDKSSSVNNISDETPSSSVHRFSITHNSIDIQWINGIPNGSVIQEIEVQAAKVREYQVDDVEKAAKAAGTEVSWDESLASALRSENNDDLKWENITQSGKLLSTESFRALNLASGASYIFRIRQRNDVHWSSYSKSSKVITTLVAAPPVAPEVIMISSGHVVAEWRTSPDAAFIFSTLRSDLRIAHLDTEGNAEASSQNIVEDEANKLDWWEADQQPTAAGKDEAYNRGDRVLIDSLKPMTTYVLKVRVLTVAGWTTWSNISKPFRTLALP